MKIKYWSGFSKRKNSTKQPTGGTEIDAYLKEDTSILNPVFDCVGVPVTVNYIYVSDFGRYYYVTDVSRVGKDRLNISCSIDVLASYKSSIGGTTAFVERSSSVDLMLPDANVVATNEIVHTDVTEGDVVPGTNTGVYVARFLGTCGIQSFVVYTMATIQNIFNSYYSQQFSWNSVENCIKSLVTALADPGKYVLSVKFFCVDAESGASDYPSWGFLTNTLQWPLAKETAHKQFSITKPSLYYNDWRDYDNRFTTVSIRFPGVGNIDIDPKYLKTNLSCWYDIDFTTGACRVTLIAGAKIIGIFDGVAGIDVPVGGLGGLGGLAAVPGLLTSPSLDVGNFANEVVGSVKNIVEDSLKPPTTLLSNAGNISEWLQYPFVTVSVTHRGSTEISPSHFGRPDMNNRTVSSLTGYMKCANVSIDITGYDFEKDAVNGYMNSGFYYE